MLLKVHLHPHSACHFKELKPSSLLSPSCYATAPTIDTDPLPFKASTRCATTTSPSGRADATTASSRSHNTANDVPDHCGHERLEVTECNMVSRMTHPKHCKKPRPPLATVVQPCGCLQAYSLGRSYRRTRSLGQTHPKKFETEAKMDWILGCEASMFMSELSRLEAVIRGKEVLSQACVPKEQYCLRPVIKGARISEDEHHVKTRGWADETKAQQAEAELAAARLEQGMKERDEAGAARVQTVRSTDGRGVGAGMKRRASPSYQSNDGGGRQKLNYDDKSAEKGRLTPQPWR